MKIEEKNPDINDFPENHQKWFLGHIKVSLGNGFQNTISMSDGWFGDPFVVSRPDFDEIFESAKIF